MRGEKASQSFVILLHSIVMSIGLGCPPDGRSAAGCASCSVKTHSLAQGEGSGNKEVRAEFDGFPSRFRWNQPNSKVTPNRKRTNAVANQICQGFQSIPASQPSELHALAATSVQYRYIFRSDVLVRHEALGQS
jgi:hypothetical protein